MQLKLYRIVQVLLVCLDDLPPNLSDDVRQRQGQQGQQGRGEGRGSEVQSEALNQGTPWSNGGLFRSAMLKRHQQQSIDITKVKMLTQCHNGILGPSVCQH